MGRKAGEIEPESARGHRELPEHLDTVRVPEGASGGREALKDNAQSVERGDRPELIISGHHREQAAAAAL
jgi:hypothetical protein